MQKSFSLIGFSIVATGLAGSQVNVFELGIKSTQQLQEATQSGGSELRSASSDFENLFSYQLPEDIVLRLKRTSDRRTSDITALKSIAQDTTLFVEFRRQAILELGKLNNKLAYEFLVENILLELPMFDVSTVDDDARSTPCFYALANCDDWEVAKAVFSSLDTRKSTLERILLAHVLKRNLGRKVADVAIKEQIEESIGSSNSNPIQTENLQALREHLNKN